MIAHGYILEKQGLPVFFADNLIDEIVDFNRDRFLISGKQHIAFR